MSTSINHSSPSLDARAVVLEQRGTIAIRNYPIEERLGPNDVRVAIHTVGICGSDVHYFVHGGIGPFEVREPMILGHEASGTVIEIGTEVSRLAVGDRVCMEPGIPTSTSEETRSGRYNLDPAVRFWATPPVHGVLRRTVVHPAAFTYKLPDSVSFAAGAMVEPLAVGVHAANRARLRVGSLAAVIGAGPIGLVTVLAAIAGGCSRVIISDIDDGKLRLAESLGPVVGVNVARTSLADALEAASPGGADVVFECSGNVRAAEEAVTLVRPGGTVVYVGMPPGKIQYDVTAAQAKEVRSEHIFRYAGVFADCVAMLASGKIDVTPLITRTFSFEESVYAFELASRNPQGQVKMQIRM